MYKYEKPCTILIDYIQILNLPKGEYKTSSRQEEIEQICIALKDVAVETGLPIIIGSQFNKNVTNQLKILPNNIAEGVDIEGLASLIVGFWNNNFSPSGSDEEINKINSKGINVRGYLYTKILKNRGGKVGLEGLLPFYGNKAKIENSREDSGILDIDELY